ncbi:MAG: methyltransferase domain-containing protein [Pseudomonadota bacterium]
MAHEYSETFFDYIEQGSIDSATQILPLIQKHLDVRSVLDVGCGRGAWLKVWAQMKVDDLCGVDGPYVDQTRLHIPSDKFVPHNLSEPFSIGRKFDLVSSLEVAEHLPRAASERFVNSLIKHSDHVLFSAAVPGQGGEHHVNERPLRFWRGLFEKQGFVPVDFLRPLMVEESQIKPWYRNNIVLYVHQSAIESLAPYLQSGVVLPQQKLRNYGGLAWFIRRSIVRCLPRAVVDLIARMGAVQGARSFEKKRRTASTART